MVDDHHVQTVVGEISRSRGHSRWAAIELLMMMVTIICCSSASSVSKDLRCLSNNNNNIML